jgi:hypothetical protein
MGGLKLTRPLITAQNSSPDLGDQPNVAISEVGANWVMRPENFSKPIIGRCQDETNNLRT